METQTGIGWLGIGTAVSVALLTLYPAWWAFIVPDAGVSRSRLASLRWAVVALFVLALLVIPASLANLGWVIVPALPLLIGVAYVIAHKNATVYFERKQCREPIGSFLGFFGPLILILIGLVAMSIGQFVVAAHVNDAAVRSMAPVMFVSFAVLAYVPPVVAAVLLFRQYRAHIDRCALFDAPDTADEPTS